ncbi:MAG: hypothetical protein JWN25_832, partial [Verrucomicrobiales bacterium]|nr:hypothetical protein [Verrucomicrobiales bacterium]
VRKQGKAPVHQLLSVLGPEALNTDPIGSRKRSRGLDLVLFSGIGIVSLLYPITRSTGKGGQSAELFFGLATCLLLFGSGLLATLLWSMSRRRLVARPTFGKLVLQNASRRSKRTLTATLLLASGVFILLVAAANKKETRLDPLVRASGTGGYNLICKTTRPLIAPSNWTNSNQILNLTGKEWEGVETIPFRKKEGDEASCLNLNKPIQPQLLGVRPELLASGRAFQFTSATKPEVSPWSELEVQDQGYSSPRYAIADATSLEWVMKIGVGDIYRFDLDNGKSEAVTIVGALKGSILQGNVIVSEKTFVKLFPNESGYRMFLVRVPSNKLDAVTQFLNSSFEDAGMQVEPASERLQRLESVENTFIATFESLGGLGLLIGTIGLAVVIFRTGMERRSEMALLRATGFKPGQILQLISFEHLFVTGCGLALGILSALPSLIPSIQAGEFHFTASLALTLGLIVVFALCLTSITSWIVSREKGFDTLRSENI